MRPYILRQLINEIQTVKVGVKTWNLCPLLMLRGFRSMDWDCCDWYIELYSILFNSLMVFEWGFNIMMSGLPIWWSTAIAVAVFGKVFMSLLCIDLYVNTQLLWLLLLEHSNSSSCVWNNITGIAVYWLICQTQLLWLLLLKHSNSSSYVWKSIDVIIVYRLICQTQLLWLLLSMSLLCIDLHGW